MSGQRAESFSRWETELTTASQANETDKQSEKCRDRTYFARTVCATNRFSGAEP
jgi:hypothetical protein